MILLNPGPVTLTPRVRQALAGEDLCHREPEFAELMSDIHHRLSTVYPESSDAFEPVILTGSGTAAVEAMLSTLAPRDTPTVVLCNGVYGERMANMLTRQGKPLLKLEHPWAASWDFTALEQLLDVNPAATHVAAVHHETTTGRLNDLPALARIARHRGIKLLIDAVSSFAGEPLDWTNWPIEALAATANKCVHGAPGMSFVFVAKSRLADGASYSPSLYLDLFTYHQAQSNGACAFTSAVPVCRALQVALIELAASGGWPQRHARYQQLSRSLRQHFASLDLPALIPSAEAAATLTAFPLPPEVNHQVWHDHLKTHGFVIYGGQGEFAQQIFRIANMGAITDADWQRLFDVIENQLQKAKR